MSPSALLCLVCISMTRVTLSMIRWFLIALGHFLLFVTMAPKLSSASAEAWGSGTLKRPLA